MTYFTNPTSEPASTESTSEKFISLSPRGPDSVTVHFAAWLVEAALLCASSTRDKFTMGEALGSGE